MSRPGLAGLAPGVIGIVASKLKDRFNRPVVLFNYENGKATVRAGASRRSR